jgi:hypothetical protein
MYIKVTVLLHLTKMCGGINPFNAELNPINHLLALLRAHHILHISRIRVKQMQHGTQMFNVTAVWN